MIREDAVPLFMGTKQLMDKIRGRLKYSVLFFVSTVEKKSSCDHKLLTMKKKRKVRDSEERKKGLNIYL